mgnify:CR=1 FL=1
MFLKWYFLRKLEAISNFEIEKNSNKLKISDEYGCETLSAYEMDIKELDSNIYGFINNRIKSLTKLKLEQSFVIKYNNHYTN